MNTSKRFTDYLPLPNQNILSLFLTDPVEVLDIIEEMKSKESQDFNGVCSKGIKFVAMELSPPLAATIYYVFNLCFKNGKFPANWKISTVNSEISTIYDWFCANKLNININKTKAILFGSSKNELQTCQIVCIPESHMRKGIKRKDIHLVKTGENVRLLGIYFDHNLNFDCFFEKLIRTLLFSAYVLRKVCNTMDSRILKLICFAFFHSHLEFSSMYKYFAKKKTFKTN